MKYYIETYGCSLSEFDSAVAESMLSRGGHVRVSTPEEADCLLVNTCAVRLDTEQRIAERLQELASRFPSKKMVVMGCLAKARPGLVARVAPKASLLSPQNVTKVLEVVESGQREVLLEGSRDTSSLPLISPRDANASIMIQEGCLGDCSFCITKVARRQIKSYAPRQIVELVRELVSRGVVEIRLTGVDVGAYGWDLAKRPMLPDLLRSILEGVEGDYMLRVGMMTPDLALEIIDDLLEAYQDERVFKYFHLPVQSGDDEVLKAMNRKYTVEEYKELHRKIKSKYPDAMIATDIIVGHPGEDEEAFENTVKLVRELRFEKVHLAQYSIRPHTRAAAMPQVPDGVKKARSKLLNAVIEEIGLSVMGSYYGKRVEALVTERGHREGTVTARMRNYIPVVVSPPVPYGRWVRVEITDYTFFDIRGKTNL
ncbi:MAG: tRNA (N(6)-L-threonylcarbamoyladenosine(37)-C(2))-methylthiotransferase [Acidilobaceae archaeon]|nr:tRNA (N(6)-L-threonylcarbamoyladenosine(37)-C(2))-methylthiotransferase [Acidilobaceae archaeon]MCX8165567.1 tRNA (N(6)-L-threonylcarbamoyladenosine(37)-C(2))-methylthiotransferase [Acidilobaceae archaeon]MDW7973994.1 tRNA (N(6)-L-threonylcarbamoyladenosine(37)-C(2))-methylthiotransferase [Sulfolobales archaeon]